MATTGTGFDVPIQLNLQRREADQSRKEALKDSELQGKIGDLINQRSALVSKISTLDQGTPEYQQAFDALKQVNTGLVDVYHPQKNPGAIEKFGHLLTDHLGIKVGGETLPQRRQDKTDALAATKDKAATTQTQQQVAGAPLSPAQEATGKAKADLATIQAAEKNFDTLNPNATPEQKQSFLTDLIQKTYGTTIRGNWTNIAGKMNGQPVTLLFDKATRQYRLQNGEAVPEEMLATFMPDTKTTEVDRERQEYGEAVKNGYKGSFIQYKTEEAAKGRAAAPKPETLDNQYKAILVKESSGQPLTPDEKAHKAAWQLYNQETKIDPGVARAAAFGAMRYIQVVDPSNPENVVMMRAGDAAKTGANTPASIGFKTDQAITRYMTSGAGGTNINYFNTATDHLRLLAQAGEALNNGNIQLFNEYANRFATATGDPAPSNFETVKAAVAGELSKTFKGTGATDAEISDINTTINQAQSPQQIQGAIQYYSSLMGSKVHALQLQYEAGKQGKPNFPGTTPAAPGGAPKHKIKIGKKFYTYNGTGDTADLKNYTEVK